jgi:hypothetical protein
MLKHCFQSCHDVSHQSSSCSGGFPLDSRFGRSADILDEMDREEAARFSPLSKSTSYYSMASRHWNRPNRQQATSSASVSTIRVYAQCLRPHLSYKTVIITSHTTSREVVLGLLNRFRLRHQDPQLFYINMEINIGGIGRGTIQLEDSACIADLITCNPWGTCKFMLKVRQGFVVKIHDSEIRPDSVYKSIILSQESTVEDTITILRNCYHSLEPDNSYSLHEFCTVTLTSRLLEGSEKLLAVIESWTSPSSNVIQVRRRLVKVCLPRGRVQPPQAFSRSLLRNSLLRQSIRKKRLLSSTTPQKKADDLDVSWESLELACRSLETGLEACGLDGNEDSSSGVSSFSSSSSETLSSL